MNAPTQMKDLKAAQAAGSATRAVVTDPKSFPALLEKMKPQLAMALPKHMNADRMLRVALTAFRNNKKLGECDPTSVCASVVMASQLGLETNVLGQSFLVPYYNKATKRLECQFIPGWMGLVDLVQRSGRGSVHTGVIFSDQRYTFTDGSHRELTIHNETELESPEEITHFYAIGWIKGVEHPQIELWTAAKVRRHRDRYNKVGERHYSYDNWEMYGRKVPLLQVLKYMPKSIELSTAMQLDHAAESGAQGINLNDAVEGTFVQVDQAEEQQSPSVDKETGEIKTAEPDKPAATATAEKSTETPPAGEQEEPPPSGDSSELERQIKEATTTEAVMAIMKMTGTIEDAGLKAKLSALSNARVKELRAAKKAGTAATPQAKSGNQFE